MQTVNSSADILPKVLILNCAVLGDGLELGNMAENPAIVIVLFTHAASGKDEEQRKLIESSGVGAQGQSRDCNGF
jgi:hypothetical protein